MSIMEKYCTKCGKVFDDLNYKICPFCGGKLTTRYGRQPIPRKLRHEVFKRDGYRCRECGASKDETSLEIDHIVPVARGGTNDIDNLQTLCRECNRMKHTDEWVGGETDLKSLKIRYDKLKKEITQIEQKLNTSLSEDEIIDFKFSILKYKEELVYLEDEIKKLGNEEKRRKKIINEAKRKKELYKKLYVTLDDETIKLASKYLGLNSLNKHMVINSLIEKYRTEFRIKRTLNGLKKPKTINKKASPNSGSKDMSRSSNTKKEKKGTKICPKCGKYSRIGSGRCIYCNYLFGYDTHSNRHMILETNRDHLYANNPKSSKKYKRFNKNYSHCNNCGREILNTLEVCPFCNSRDISRKSNVKKKILNK